MTAPRSLPLSAALATVLVCASVGPRHVDAKPNGSSAEPAIVSVAGLRPSLDVVSPGETRSVAPAPVGLRGGLEPSYEPSMPVAAQPAWVEPPAPVLPGAVTFEGAVRQAVRYHPSIAETISRLDQQGEAVNEARSGYLPRVSWGVDSSYNSANRYRPMLSVSGSQMVYDFGKVDGRIRVAKAGVEGRRSQILSAVDQIARDTAYAAIELSRGAALRRVAQEQVRDTRQILDLVKSRTTEGASTRSDLLQAESRVQAAQSTLLEIEAQQKQAEVTLASLVGDPKATSIKGNFPAWLDRACGATDKIDWARIPAIMQADAEQAAAKAQIDLSRAEALPTLSLDASVGSDLARIGSSDPQYGIGLKISGSLYNGGESRARQNAATYALGASSAAVARTRLEVGQQLAQAASQISSLRALHQSLAGREANMRETRELYQTQYLELGTRTLLDVLNAAQELHAARFDMHNIRHDLLRLNVDCTYASGNIRGAFSLKGQAYQGFVL